MRSNGNFEWIRIDPESLYPTHSPAPRLSLHPTEIPARVPTWPRHSDTDNTALLSLSSLTEHVETCLNIPLPLVSSRLIRCQAEDEACECPGPDFQRDWAWSWSASDHAATLDKVSRGVERRKECCRLPLRQTKQKFDLIFTMSDMN